MSNWCSFCNTSEESTKLFSLEYNDAGNTVEWVCSNCDEEIQTEAIEAHEQKYSKCSCGYCPCHSETEYGVVCDDCRAGVHQG